MDLVRDTRRAIQPIFDRLIIIVGEFGVFGRITGVSNDIAVGSGVRRRRDLRHRISVEWCRGLGECRWVDVCVEVCHCVSKALVVDHVIGSGVIGGRAVMTKCRLLRLLSDVVFDVFERINVSTEV